MMYAHLHDVCYMGFYFGLFIVKDSHKEDHFGDVLIVAPIIHVTMETWAGFTER